MKIYYCFVDTLELIMVESIIWSTDTNLNMIIY